MKIKSFKKLVEKLNRNDGVSLIAIIAMLVIMSVMGGVFSSVMGRWKISAPTTINSSKALYLAETAAMFALQDASYKFYGGNFNYGTSTDDPYVVSSVTTGNVTEVADYWFEMPTVTDDFTVGANDDVVNDDTDDGNLDLYTIIATGRVKIGSATVAKRQIKIKATINPYPPDYIPPGVSTDGVIDGNGNPGLEISHPDLGTITYNNPVPPNSPSTGTETGTEIVHRPALPILDSYMFKAQAKDQQVTSGAQQYYSADLTLGPSDTGYPNDGYYFTGNIPNIIFVGNDLDVSGFTTVHGVYWVKGNVELGGNCRVNGIIICEGSITDLNGQAQVDGGLIQYGGGIITGNGNPSIINIVDSHFTNLGETLADVDVVSSQEAVSAN